jgi:hypothetical protein
MHVLYFINLHGVYHYFFQSIYLILYICFGVLITFLVWGQGYFWKVMAPRFFICKLYKAIVLYFMFYKFGVYIFLGSGLFLWGGVVFGGYTSRDVFC